MRGQTLERNMASSCSSHLHKTASGTTTHYLQRGTETSRLVILLHGLGGSTDTFTPILNDLPGDGFEIVNVDLEGFGKTMLSHPDVRLSIDRYVADLDDLIHFKLGSKQAAAADYAESNGKRVLIVGHSLGSIIALHYAATRPDLLAGLALLGVGRSASHIPAARQRMLDLAAKARTEGMTSVADLAKTTNFPVGDPAPAEGKDAVRHLVESGTVEAYARTCEAIASLDHVDPDYSKIQCPTVFISGDIDILSPKERAEDLAMLVGGKSVVRVVRGGHQPALSDPEGVGEALDLFFNMALEIK